MKSFIAFTVVFLTPAIALADETILTKLTSSALDILIPAVSALVMFFAHRLISLAENKWKFQVSTETSAKIDQFVQDAIRYAEEKARPALRGATEQVKGSDKMEMALSYVVDQMKSSGMEDQIKEKLQKLIESKLHYMRQKDLP